MSKRSFERINYMLRPNKNVERKLIAQSLISISKGFNIKEYRYVGFGSVWFTDFILMHKAIGISDMHTIENQKSRAKRIEFNKPFSCIQIWMEDSSTALGEIIDEKRSLVWLDYDGPLSSALNGDIETVIGAASSGSMLLVTINARVEQLRGNKKEEVELTPAQFLSEVTGELSTPERESKLTPNEFPSLASKILFDRMKSAVLLKPDHFFIPIWCFKYADDADMITVGGMIAKEPERAALHKTDVFSLNYITAEELYEISLPILTEREKRSFDRLLPSNDQIKASDLEFELKDRELEAYRKFYLEYPIFSEMWC